MMTTWMRKPATLGLSLGATLMAAVFGCGGQGTESGDAVVVPDSTAKISSAAPAKSTGAPAAGSSAPAAAASSTTPVKAEGYGTLKGQVVFDGPAPEVKILYAKDTKDKDVCTRMVRSWTRGSSSMPPPRA